MGSFDSVSDRDSNNSQRGSAEDPRRSRNRLTPQPVKKSPEELRKERVATSRKLIDDRFAQFDGGYFDGLRNAARNFYQPQFQDQYDAARERLMFGLARTGNLHSSSGAHALGDLARDRGLALTRIEDTATDAIERKREALENQRQQLYSQAEAAENPAEDARLSLERSQYLNRAPKYEAIGDFFTRALNQASIYQEGANRGNRGFGGFFNNLGSYFSGSGASGSAKVVT